MKAEDFVHEITQTSAIFGRQKDVAVEFQGDQAYTDGSTIVLPSLPQGMEFSREDVLAIRGYLDHEAGRIRHTDLTLVKPFGDAHGREAHAIANCLEGIRLEAAVMREYPGSEKNIRGIFDSIKDKEVEFISGHPELYGDKATINNVTAAITTLGREDYLSSNYKEAVMPMIQPKWQAWGRKWREEVLKCKNTKEVMNMALAIKKLLDETTQMEQEKPEEGKGDPQEGKGLDGNPEDFTFDPDGDPTKGGKGKPQDGKGKEVEGPTAPSEDTSKFCDTLLKDRVDQFLKYKTTDKKVKYRVFTTKHDEVYSTTSTNKRVDERVDTMRRGTSQGYESVKSKIGGQVNTMKARLRRALMAKERRDWDFGREFGKLDTKRLVSGFQGAQGIFKQRKDRVEANTCVMLLVDLSGSMSGDKVDVARDSVIAFAECLEGTQLKYEINGFDNGSRYTTGLQDAIGKQKNGAKFHRVEPLNIFQFKKFDDPLRVSKGAIGAIGEMANGNNSDRDAVLWCLQRLAQQRTQRKILIVLSDGSPHNFTINIERNELTKALTDTVSSAMKDYGVECVGIGIQADHVSEIYKQSVVIDDVKDLSGGIFNQLSELLTGGKVRF
jgi:cobalamin biosynthesis protein CobT